MGAPKQIEQHIMEATDEASLIEFLHEGAMGGHPVKASAARCLKEVMPALLRWIDKEKERGTSPGVAIMATADIAISAMFTTVINVTDDPRLTAENTDRLKTALDEQFAAACAKVRSEGPRS